MLLLFLFGCSLLSACAQRPGTATVPDTPAGKQLIAWLQAFNAGRRETLRQFVSDHFDPPPQGPLPVEEITRNQWTLYRQTGGFAVRKIVQSSPVALTVLAQATLTEFWMEIQVFVTAEPPDYVRPKAPYKMVGFGFRNVPAPEERLPAQPLSASEIRQRLDRLMTRLVAADQFSGTVLVAQNGKLVYARAFGLADRAWKMRNRVDTRFNLASITKMFTAVAVAQLVEQGRLAYTDPIGKILADYPNRDVAQRVTVHHLLSHTSGLIGARELVEKSPQPPTARTIAEMIKPFVNEPLRHPPGQQFDYSNAGFILLGAVIEKVSGQTYYDYVREHIFRPAGMMHTDFYALDTDPPNLAVGYKDGPDGARLNNLFDLGVKGSPAGGAYATAEDMVRFHQALIGHRLLREPSLKTLWTGVTEQPDHSEYGYGAQIAHYNGNRIVWHGGGWQGITNQFDLYPERGYTVVILSNYDDDPTSIALKLREWLTQGQPAKPHDPLAFPALSVTATVSSTQTGIGNPITITVSVANAGETAHASVVDMEIKDAKGAKANQQYSLGQKIEMGQRRTYTYVWTPTAAGTYTIDVGVFGAGWSPKHCFQSGLAAVVVK